MLGTRGRDDLECWARLITMNRTSSLLLGVCVCLAFFGSERRAAGQQTGTLVFDLKNYTSDAKIPKRNQKMLEHAGLRWGLLDSGVLISFINEGFVKADMPYLTRYGEQKTLEMKPGHYAITCIGYEFNSTAQDPDKHLAKTAFFNNEVVPFTVSPGKATTLEIVPVYEAESQWRVLTKVTVFLPDLKVRVLEDGKPTGAEVVINRRTDKSVAWDDYRGPLKF